MSCYILFGPILSYSILFDPVLFYSNCLLFCSMLFSYMMGEGPLPVFLAGSRFRGAPALGSLGEARLRALHMKPNNGNERQQSY